jgi:hypothetical protein
VSCRAALASVRGALRNRRPAIATERQRAGDQWIAGKDQRTRSRSPLLTTQPQQLAASRPWYPPLVGARRQEDDRDAGKGSEAFHSYSAAIGCFGPSIQLPLAIEHNTADLYSSCTASAEKLLAPMRPVSRFPPKASPVRATSGCQTARHTAPDTDHQVVGKQAAKPEGRLDTRRAKGRSLVARCDRRSRPPDDAKALER